MSTPYNDPAQEQRWAKQRHACLIRACVADPLLANGILAMQLRRSQQYGTRLFEDLAAWIAAHPEEGKRLLDRWDQIQPKSRGDTTDPNYAAALRVRARQLFFSQQQEQSQCPDCIS